MSHLSFVVSRFKNRNGVFSWRVDGRLNGVRIRRNFKTQEEAAAEKATLEIKALQLASGLRGVTTCLTEDQVRDAEAVFRRISNRGHSLLIYVDFALTNYREPAFQKLLTKAIAEYIAAKEHEFEQDLISLEGVGSDAGREPLAVEGFMDGSDRWIIRFAAPRAGVSTFRTASSDSGMDRLAGRVTVSPTTREDKSGLQRVETLRMLNIDNRRARQSACHPRGGTQRNFSAGPQPEEPHVK